jgi:hypothetical protein
MSWYSVIDNRYTVNGDWRLAAGIFSNAITAPTTRCTGVFQNGRFDVAPYKGFC